MFETLALTQPELVLIGVASCLAGLCVALLVASVVNAASGKSEQVKALVAEVQAAAPKEDEGLIGIAKTLMPIFLPIARQIELTEFKKTMGERHKKAGYPGAFSVDELFAMGLMLGILLMVLVSVLIVMVFPKAIIAAPILVALGPVLVSSNLESMAQERLQKVGRTLPFVLDLLVLVMRAGASLPMAMNRVKTDYAGHPIGDEFALTIRDLDMGSTSKQSFSNLADRCPHPAVKYLVDEIVQSEELGRPIADTLESLGDRFRVRRVQDATDTAGKAKVKVLAPGVLVLFAGLILLLSPFGMRFFHGNDLSMISG
jgi:tight adherence protein C